MACQNDCSGPPHDPSGLGNCEAAICARRRQGWRSIVLNFTPSWFSVNMGTGITSILLHNLPYNGRWLQYISYILFALNVLLFVVFLAISILRYCLYPKIWVSMIRHPAQCLFIGTFPMGLATIINMIVFVCVPSWQGSRWKVAWALWWIDAAISVSSCFYLPFVLMTVHGHSVETMTAAWLLPVVSTIVAAATGSLVAGVLPHAEYALITILTSYVLWGTGVSLAMVILVIYFLRLTTHDLPPKAVVVSTFLPLGPLGQGGFGIMQLGKVALEIFPQTHTVPAAPHAGEILYVAGFFTAIIMWGFGLVWLCFAVATVVRSQRFPFNMGWWGFTFPLGVYTVCTTTLAKEIPSVFFRVLGTIFSVAVTILWIIVSLGTLQHMWKGSVLAAPCLKDVEEREAKARGTTASEHEMDE